MRQQNQFHKGVISDLHYSKVTPDSWVFPTLNIRIFNNDGQGFIATSLAANEKALSLRTDYVVIGATVYDGVAYIVSCRRQGGTLGEAEIGCYPSPRCYNVDMTTDVITGTGIGIGWERKYKPIINFTDTINPQVNSIAFTDRKVLRSTLLNMYPNKQIEMFAREDYDESLTLFLTDFSDPVKVFNTGIKKDGSLNTRYLWQGSFPNQTSLIPGNSGILKVSQFNIIEDTGSLKCGNYIYFFRYLDDNLTPTNVVGESRACQVYMGNPATGSQVQGAFGNTPTTKKVRLTLENVDVNYKFIEVMYVRYYSDNTNNVIPEEYLIGTQFPINGQTTVTIEHVNHSNEIIIDIGDIIKTSGYFRTCKSITHIDNKFYGANWAGIKRHHPSLSELASRIKIGATDKDTTPAPVAITGSMHNMQHKNYRDTFNSVSYFRGEVYGFAVVFVFKDGYYSQAYPCKGIDAYNLTTGQINGEYNNPNNTTINNKGIFRFPNREKSTLYAGNELIKRMAVEFMTADADAYLTASTGQWIRDNVAGIIFVRTNRYENLLYQGLTINVCKSEISVTAEAYTRRYENLTPATYTYQTIAPSSNYIKFPDGDLDDTKRDSIASIPLMYREFPWFYSRGSNNTDREHFAGRMFAVPNRYALISMDYISDPSKQALAGYMKEVGKIQRDQYSRLQAADIFPQRTLYVMNNLSESSHFITTAGTSVLYPKKEEGITGAIYNVPVNIYPNAKIASKYISASRDGRSLDNTVNELCMLWQEKSNKHRSVRDMRTCQYLGIETVKYNEIPSSPSEENQVLDYNNSIVNIYKIDPTTVNNIAQTYYNINELYYQISDVIQLSSWNQLEKCYNGDCFLQMNFIKQMGWESTWYTSNIGISVVTQNFQDNMGARVWYGHGVIIGLVTENATNSAMRFNSAQSTYYPYQGDANFFARESRETNQGRELFLFNRGYDKILSPRGYNLFDDMLPQYITKKPTMVQMSEQHFPYSFVDNYRLLPVTARQDYDIKYGEIMSIGHLNNVLYTIQRSAINQHFTGEQKLLQDPDTTSLNIVLGSADALSPKARTIAEFGTQHQWSVLKTDNAIYGVDFNKSIIWQISMYSGDKGGIGLKAENLLKKNLNKKWLTDLKDEFGYDYSDIAESNLHDNPAMRTGILTGYDRDNGEVLFSFIMTRRNKVKPDIRTLVYNEEMGIFTGEYNYLPNNYLTINNDFYSINNFNDLYLHNIKGKDLELYGQNEQAILSFIVNGAVNEEQNYTSLNKQYDAIAIESQKESFDKIEYETPFQKATQSPFVDPIKFWLDPEYQEGKWKLPIKEADTSTTSQYSVESQMKGEWLKVSLYYKRKIRMMIKNIQTIFKISHS